jgi:hypothetical protein
MLAGATSPRGRRCPLVACAARPTAKRTFGTDASADGIGLDAVKASLTFWMEETNRNDHVDVRRRVAQAFHVEWRARRARKGSADGRGSSVWRVCGEVGAKVDVANVALYENLPDAVRASASVVVHDVCDRIEAGLCVTRGSGARSVGADAFLESTAVAMHEVWRRADPWATDLVSHAVPWATLSADRRAAEVRLVRIARFEYLAALHALYADGGIAVKGMSFATFAASFVAIGRELRSDGLLDAKECLLGVKGYMLKALALRSDAEGERFSAAVAKRAARLAAVVAAAAELRKGEEKRDEEPLQWYDYETVLARVAEHGADLQFAFPSHRADRTIVLAALASGGVDVLIWANDALRSDRDVVRAAIAIDGTALRWASEELTKDRALVLAGEISFG